MKHPAFFSPAAVTPSSHLHAPGTRSTWDRSLSRRRARRILAVLAAGLLCAAPARADSLLFNSGNPDGKMATASRPAGGGNSEIESADDFDFTTPTRITAASFFGLLPNQAVVSAVNIEIYRVFPKDSTVPPDGNVPTRTNSPADVAFAERDSAAAELTFSASLINSTFTADNSVRSGINPLPNQATGGDGPVTGREYEFAVSFASPIVTPNSLTAALPSARRRALKP